MNETTTPTPTPTSKPKRTRKSKSPRTPHIPDPAEQAIKAEAKRQIEEHRLALKSGKVLETVFKLCGRLTREHRELLVATLNGEDAKQQ